MNRTIGLLTANYSTSGFGTLTEKRPPACIPFGGRYRLMDFALSNMVNSRISTVGLITPYYYRSIMDHVGAGKEWGLDKKEGGLFILPGTVFGLKEENAHLLLRDIIHNSNYLARGDGDYILVSGCSLVYNMDYQPMIAKHELQGWPITILYRKTKHGEKHRGYYLTLDENGTVTGIQQGEEGENLFMDCFLIDKSFLLRFMRDFRALGYMDFMDIVRQNLDMIKVNSWRFDGYVGYTDGLEDYMRSSLDLLNPEVQQELFPADRQIRTKIHDTPPASYVPGSVVKNSMMTAGSVIEGTVENSIIFRNVRVEKGAVVRNCVLMEKCVIKAGAWLEYVVCDKNVTISPSTCITGSPEHPCVLAKDAVI